MDHALRGSLGQQNAAANNMPAAPAPDTFQSLLAQIDQQIQNAQVHLDRARSVADVINGGVPTPVDKTSNAVEPGSLIARWSDRIARLDYVLGQLDGQLRRVENSL